jgi:hypothetical protein
MNRGVSMKIVGVYYIAKRLKWEGSLKGLQNYMSGEK